MPAEFKMWEWIFEKGLSVGLVIYFVIWFTQKIDPKLTTLIDGIAKLIDRNDHRDGAFETVVKAKTQTAETVAKIETKVDKLQGTLDAVLAHVQRP